VYRVKGKGEGGGRKGREKESEKETYFVAQADLILKLLLNQPPES